ncbi:MAG: PQQ-like beta-propeller repeat protein, partial [Actinomycetia bacterium]|nr:PQQ-like beta-propeller repeat protein [Actinomycetes bacterium]
YCLNKSDGSLKWKYKAENRIIGSRPVVNNGTIYFGDYSGILYAVDINGNLKWKYSSGARITSTAVIYKGIVCFVNGTGTIIALNSEGSKIWSKDINVKPDIIPYIYNETIYIGTDKNRVFSLDINTGKEISSHEIKAAATSTAIIKDNKLIIGMDNNSLGIYELE